MRYQEAAPAAADPDHPSPVVIVGAGVGGLGAALALARAGLEVVVLERDEVTDPGDPEAAFVAPRRGAPQARQTHGLLARLTRVLRERFPDVLDELFVRGAAEWPLVTADLGTAQPADDELAVLLVRRTTLEWVLRRAVEREPGITTRGGVKVERLVHAIDPDAGRPVVTGVRLAGGEMVEAAAVIASPGRRSNLRAWFEPGVVDLPEDEHATNLIYFTRWYRFPDGTVPVMDPKMTGDLGFLKYLAVPGDGGTFSVTLAIPTVDRDLRAQLLDPRCFDRAAQLLPGAGKVFASHDLTPISEVEPMGGFVNRLRRFTDDEGEPLVSGFHAVGDAHTCTNPFYGRGCSLALVQAVLLADAFAAHPDDPRARSLAYEEASTREIEPWFHQSVEMDRVFRVGPTVDAVGAEPARPMDDPENPLGAVMAASATDPVIGRAMIRVFNLLTRPDELMNDPAFVTRVMEVLADPSGLPRPVLAGPTRDELLAAG